MTAKKVIRKPSYIGAPAVFELEMACQQVNDALGGFGCYLVGSALERQDWRDVDVRYIMDDKQFKANFPSAGMDCRWEHDPRWLLMTCAITEWLRKKTGLPIDFQIQPQSFANARHDKARSAIGLRLHPE